MGLMGPTGQGGGMRGMGRMGRMGRGGRGGGFRLPPRMMMRLIVVAVAGITAWFGKQNIGGEKSAPAQRDGDFQVYGDCKLVSNKYNDGDSFMVSHNGKQQEYRLYFVDTPESKDKPYDDHKDRVRKQGSALGGLSYNETLKVGQEARAYTKKALSQPFRIYTTGELVYEGPRQYAFVQVKHQGEDRWLHELIVEEGLGRIHTKGVETPEGKNWRKQKDYLISLESKAKKAQEGAWGN